MPPRRHARLLLALPLMTGFLAAREGQPSAPQLQAATLQAAIERYAPILVLHQYEKYLPTSVESYLTVTRPFRYRDRDSGKVFQGLQYRTPLPRNPAVLDLFRRGDPARAKVYVNVKVGASRTDLQYWFLYAYNGPGTAYVKQLGPTLRYQPLGTGEARNHLGPGDYLLGELGVHEGDWEHVTVTIDNRSGQALQGVYLAAHSGGQFSPLIATPEDPQPRVQVYASRNGHATYPDMARYYPTTVKAGALEFRLLDDTQTPGLRVDFRGHWELIGLQGDSQLKADLGFQEPAFVRDYPGRWGRVLDKPHPLAGVPILGSISETALRVAGAYDELTFEAGPYPPWSKDSWTGPE